LLLAFIPSQNIDTLLFYLTFYVLMNIGLLFIYEVLSSSDEDTALETLSGLGHKHPLLGILMLITVASLIGIPPFIGFLGKVFIVNTLFVNFSLDSIQSITGIVIVFTTFLSLVYYLKLPYYLFVKKYEDSIPRIINKRQLCFSAILVLPLIVGFFSFDWLLHWLQYVK
ncbi:MAG TPA: proton-conducting transporter membrane subunit, partial [Cytophagales bacterium]|nr:proton-conducting transporter membrane subunit [Cytophagales bacterium]